MTLFYRSALTARAGPARLGLSRVVAPLRRRPGLSLGIALLLVATVLAVLQARGPIVPTAIAARTDVEQRVVASGRVRVVTRVQVSPRTAGLVVAVPVREGQRVGAGDLLVRLDDAEARAEAAQARAAVREAEGRVEQLRKVGAIVATESSREAGENLVRAEADLERAEGLASAGLLADADLEEARRRVEIARAQKKAADAQQAAATPRGVDTGIALSELVQSRAQLAGAEARLEQTRLVAPEDGLVLSRAVEPGDTVQPGDTLLELAADGETQLVIEPDERNLAWIRPGQRSRASADAFPEDVFDAVVSYVSPAIDPRRGSVEVRLRVPDPPPYLRADMTVSVDLRVASKSGVLAVPSEAVRDVASGAPWVPVVENGRVARRAVVVGIRGEGHTEIERGLEEGAEVVLSTDTPLDDGRRVRPERGGR